MRRVRQPLPEDIGSVALIAFDFNDKAGRNLGANMLPLFSFLPYLGAEVPLLEVSALSGGILKPLSQFFPVGINPGIEDAVRGTHPAVSFLHQLQQLVTDNAVLVSG